jgi:peptidoglycan L-alanyl-D-glutamate endopeptidase CwlK
MPSFSLESKNKLITCHPDLQRIANELIKEFDFSVRCGYRDKAAQELAVREGHSREHWPHSKHNSFPSIAMDILPHPFSGDWHDLGPFNNMLDRVERIAKAFGIKVRLGRNMPHLMDYPHVELR